MRCHWSSDARGKGGLLGRTSSNDKYHCSFWPGNSETQEVYAGDTGTRYTFVRANPVASTASAAAMANTLRQSVEHRPIARTIFILNSSVECSHHRGMEL